MGTANTINTINDSHFTSNDAMTYVIVDVEKHAKKKEGSGDKEKKPQANYQMDYVMKMAAQRRRQSLEEKEDGNGDTSSSSSSTDGEP